MVNISEKAKSPHFVQKGKIVHSNICECVLGGRERDRERERRGNERALGPFVRPCRSFILRSIYLFIATSIRIKIFSISICWIGLAVARQETLWKMSDHFNQIFAENWCGLLPANLSLSNILSIFSPFKILVDAEFHWKSDSATVCGVFHKWRR